MTNAWGCMEILPTHCSAGSVKVNYHRCMRKIWGLVKPHKVNIRQMRLLYYRIYFNMKITNNLIQKHCDRVIRFGVICFCLTQIKLLREKIVFRIHIQWSLWCFSLARNNALARCFANLFQSKNLSEFGKILRSILLKVRKTSKYSRAFSD